MALEQPKMVPILPKKNWSSPSTMFRFDRLSPKKKSDLCIIAFDVRKGEPEVLEVQVDVFHNKTRMMLSSESKMALEEILGTLEVKSNQELMECLKQSKVDKQKGNVRKYEDIARECGYKL